MGFGTQAKLCAGAASCYKEAFEAISASRLAGLIAWGAQVATEGQLRHEALAAWNSARAAQADATDSAGA